MDTEAQAAATTEKKSRRTKRPTAAKKSEMTDEHKAALAVGRDQSRVVKAYLTGIDSVRPKRGRKRTPESIQARLEAIEATLPTSDPLNRLLLTQEKMDLTEELARFEDSTEVDLEQLEKEFVAVAAEYSARKNITWSTWRSVGVPASVLKEAGITRASAAAVAA